MLYGMNMAFLPCCLCYCILTICCRYLWGRKKNLRKDRTKQVTLALSDMTVGLLFAWRTGRHALLLHTIRAPVSAMPHAHSSRGGRACSGRTSMVRQFGQHLTHPGTNYRAYGIAVALPCPLPPFSGSCSTCTSPTLFSSGQLSRSQFILFAMLYVVYIYNSHPVWIFFQHSCALTTRDQRRNADANLYTAFWRLHNTPSRRLFRHSSRQYATTLYHLTRT